MRRWARLCHGAREKIKEHRYAIWLDPWSRQAGPTACWLYPWCSEPRRFFHKIITGTDPCLYFPTLCFLPTQNRHCRLNFPPFSLLPSESISFHFYFHFLPPFHIIPCRVYPSSAIRSFSPYSFYSSLFLCYHIQARPPSHLAWRTGVLIYSIIIL